MLRCYNQWLTVSLTCVFTQSDTNVSVVMVIPPKEDLHQLSQWIALNSFRTTPRILKWNMPSRLLSWVWDLGMCLTHHWETVTLGYKVSTCTAIGLLAPVLLSTSAFPLDCNTVLFNHFIFYQQHTTLTAGHTCISSVNRSFNLHVAWKRN